VTLPPVAPPAPAPTPVIRARPARRPSARADDGHRHRVGRRPDPAGGAPLLTLRVRQHRAVVQRDRRAEAGRPGHRPGPLRPAVPAVRHRRRAGARCATAARSGARHGAPPAGADARRAHRGAGPPPGGQARGDHQTGAGTRARPSSTSAIGWPRSGQLQLGRRGALVAVFLLPRIVASMLRGPARIADTCYARSQHV
jgi:hypothetical protein